MAGSKRRRKAADTAISAPPAAKAKTDGNEDATLENVFVDFANGFLPWTEASEDRTAAVAALLDGKAMVLSLDSAGGFGVGGSIGSTAVTVPAVVSSAVAEMEIDEGEGVTTRATSAPASDKKSSKKKKKDSKKTNAAQLAEAIIPKPELYGYWMSLGSHILSRLLVEHSASLLSQTNAITTDAGEEHDTDNQHESVAYSYRRLLCYFCHMLSMALYEARSLAQQTRGENDEDDSMEVDNSALAIVSTLHDKWDKASTGISRHWLARLVTSIAAAAGGHALTPTPSSRARGKSASNASGIPLNRSALAAVTLCMERLAQAGGGPIGVPFSSSSSGSENYEYMGTSAQISQHWRTMVQPFLRTWAQEGLESDMIQCCHTAFCNVSSDWTLERACLVALQSESPTQAELQNVFIELRSQHPTLRLEGRLAYRRWSAVVMDWYAQAPSAILNQALVVLQHQLSTNEKKEEDEEDSDDDEKEISNKTTAVILATLARWMSFVLDWSMKAGARAPSGSLDQYLKQISLGRKRKKAFDLRETALSVSFHFIEQHGVSLGTVSSSKGLGACQMLNDSEYKEYDVVWPSKESDRKNTAPTEKASSFYPFTAQTLSNLARIGSASGSIPNAVELIENASAAFVLQQKVLRDVHLLHWALQQARLLMAQFDSSSSGSYDHLIEDPIVAPHSTGRIGTRILILPTSSKTRRGGTESSSQSSAQRVSVYERFAFFLRAMHDDNTNPGHHKKMGTTKGVGRSFVGTLLKIAESCLDTRETLPSGAVLFPTPIQGERNERPKKRKPATPSATAKRRSKRRKKDDAETLPPSKYDAHSVSARSHPGGENQILEYRSINSGRSALASVVFNIAQEIISQSRPAGKKFPCLGSGVFGVSEISRIVQMGVVLDTVLLRTRDWDDLVDKSTEEDLMTQSPSLTSAEKRLWSSKMDLSLTIGKGNTFLGSSTPLTGRRLEVFREVARTSRAVSVDRSTGDAWPLWLPTAHWFLVSSNMATEQVDNGETVADQYIVDGVLASIEYILSDLGILLSLIPKSPKTVLADPEIPLSLQDSQLYLGAMARLPLEQRSSSVLALTKSIFSLIGKIQSDGAAMELIKQNRVVSGFLARLVTTVTHAAVLSLCEHEIRNQVLRTMESVAVGSPSFWLANEGYQGQFMGILSDRETSLLPQMTVLPNALAPEAAVPLQLLLEEAFEIGVAAAPDDSGYLMFSAWNGLGKAPVWAPAIHAPSLSGNLDDPIADALLSLRENVCLINQQIQPTDGNSPSTTIERAYSVKVGLASIAIGQNIQILIEKSLTMIESILRDYGSADLSPDVFALLEALCVSLSFAVSSLTKPKENYVAEMVAKIEKDSRPRGYSTESEGGGSDGESGATEADARVDALERIELCVTKTGGCPSHPDWLDTGCVLRSGISMDEAQALALKTLKVMTTLITTAKQNQYQSTLIALKQRGSSKNAPVLSELALKLLVDSSSDGDIDCAEQIANIANVDHKVVDCVLSRTAAISRVNCLATWCANSAQRILGQFHPLFRNQMIDISEVGLGEMRVGQEWEVALAYSLSTACIGFSGAEEGEGLTEETSDALIRSSCWEHLASTALCCLVPVSALLRFTTFRKGRDPHPHSKYEANVDDYHFSKTYLPESSPTDAGQAENLGVVVQNAIQTLSCVPLHCQETSEFIAANLFTDPSAFLKLQFTSKVGGALDTLLSFVDACDALTKKNDPSIHNTTQRIVNYLFRGISPQSNQTSSILVDFLTHQSSSVDEGKYVMLGGLGLPKSTFSPLCFGDAKKVDIADLLSPLAALVWKSPNLLDTETRHVITVELGNLATSVLGTLEKLKIDMAKQAFGSLVKIPKDRVRDIFTSMNEEPSHVASSLCTIFASLLLFVGGGRKKEFEKSIFQELMRVCHSSSAGTLPAHFLYLVCLYGIVSKELESVVSWLLEDVKGNVAMIEHLFAFLKDLKSLIQSNSPEEILRKKKIIPSYDIRTACSYVVQEGFFEQHWYNCRTCGLVEEKGCCTLCALVCHQGHDCSYARYSSFFCDCGAQNEDESLESGTFCKCLSTVSHDDIEVAYGKSKRTRLLHDATPQHATASLQSSLEFAAIATKNATVKGLLQSVTKAVSDSGCKGDLEALILDELKNWKKGGPPYGSPVDQVVTLSEKRSNLQSCRSIESQIIENADQSFRLSGVSHEGLLHLGNSFDPATEILNQLINRRNRTRKTIAAADSRGRLFVAENEKISFLNAMAIPVDAAIDDGFLQRQMLPLLGSPNVDMKNVIGLSLNRYNEQRLLLFGAEDVYALVINSECNNLQACVGIEFNTHLSDGSADKVFRADWFPHSENYFCVGFSSAMTVYSLENKALSSGMTEPLEQKLSVAVHSSHKIKDYCIVPAEYSNNSAVLWWHLFLLLSDGSVHATEIKEDDTGTLISSVGSIGGRDSRSNCLFEDKSRANSTGEGSLHFLAQSGIVVYHTLSNSVMAFVIDSAGFQRQFELIPKDFTIGEQALKDYSFANFLELGLIQRNNETYFRVICTAQGKTNYILSLEFNESESVVIRKEACLNGEASIDGLVVISVPQIDTDDDDGDEMDLFDGSKRFTERLQCCLIESNGRLSLYSERSHMTDAKLLTYSSRIIDSSFPLLTFERFKNLGSDLVCTADGSNNPDLTSKLQRDNELSFHSPRHDGFTLTIAPKVRSDGTTPIIAAFRILVGKNSHGGIPRKMYIGGRPVDFQQGVERWYSVVMSAEEIAVVVRSGFVTISFTQSPGATCNPILNAVDVYGIERDAIAWLPQKLRCLNNSATLHKFATVTSNQRPDNNLQPVANALCSLHHILPASSSSSKEWRQLLLNLVKSTSLVGKCQVAASIEELVKQSEPSNFQQLLDKARLEACVEFFSASASVQESSAKAYWLANVRVLLECLRLASGISRERPMNYLPSLDGTSSGSIASLASSPVSRCLFLTLDCKEVIGHFVEVCLLEMAVNDQNKRNFVPLRELLTHQSEAIVMASCEAISKFCTKYSSESHLTATEYDFFRRRGLTFACDSCLATIQGVRYTLSDDNHPFDLCHDCHRLAMQHSSKNSFNDSTDVIINGRSVGEDDPKLSCGDVGRMESVLMQDYSDSSRQQLYDVFLDGLFNGLVALVSEADGKKSSPHHLIQLVTELVELADRKRQVEKKKRIAKELCTGISSTLHSAHKVAYLQCYIRSLCKLVVSDAEARIFLTGMKLSTTVEGDENSKTCVVHGEKLIRKRGAGSNDVEFYVCSNEKCNFFAWANKSTKDESKEGLRSVFCAEAAYHVWKLLKAPLSGGGECLHAKICRFLENRFDQLSSENKSSSTLTFHEVQMDVDDGVLCSKERLNLSRSADEFVKGMSLLPFKNPVLSDQNSLLETCLELLCLTAGQVSNESEGVWFPLLCRISTESKVPARSLAKTAMFRLCGRNTELYFVVRDHHSLKIHFQKLVELALPLLSQGRLLKDKAKQCSPSWKDRRPFLWNESGGLELAGLQLLIAEDTMTKRESIRKVLNEILSPAKKRDVNWKRFLKHKCVPKLPTQPIGEMASLLLIPPLRLLAHLVCVLPPDCQTKGMKLLDLGMGHASEPDEVDGIHSGNLWAAVSGFVEPKDSIASNASNSLRLTESKIFQFVVSFVLNGQTTELRRSAGSVAAKLCSFADTSVVESLAERFIFECLPDVGVLGRAGDAFVTLVSNIIDMMTSSTKTKEMATFVESIWSEQLLGLSHDRANKEYVFFESRVGHTTHKKRYDLVPCVSCSHGSQHNQRHSRATTTRAGETPAGGPTSGANSGASSSNPQKKPWLSNQVAPFARVRLDSIKDSQSSNEFALFISLKYRVSISDFFVDIRDPRARFVKTIKVYASSRVVENVTQLKTCETWQEMGTLSLSQGGTTASLSLEKPMLAANLRIEYTDFFARPGSSRAADGSFVIHCPRCARTVTNAHGVCGNCGEVAFQCRKCRHINYDRLDAFLCVECGYCASGSFVYDVNAAIASNAAAITNEDECKRAQQQLELSTRLYDSLLHVAKDQFKLAEAKSAKKNKNSSRSIELPEQLKQAYGDNLEDEAKAMNLTADAVGKQGSVVKALARPSTVSILGSDAMDHYRLVQSLGRPSSGSNSSRRRDGRDIVIQQVSGRSDDDESDLIGLLESTDSLARASGLDPSDPLSRLFASVQSRREQRNESQNSRSSASRGRGEGTAAQPGQTTEVKSKSVAVILETCNKLHILLREAEREIVELKRRIKAWDQLQQGEFAKSPGSGAFVPSHCWSCAGSLAGHILLLWIHLFQKDPSEVPVTSKLVRLLLQDDQGTSKGLLEWKHLAVREIALRSDHGASLVLDSLRLRLRASQDVSAAEILGQIIGAPNGNADLKEKFVQLAHEQLNVNYS